MDKRLLIISRTMIIISMLLFISGMVVMLLGMKSIILIGVLFSTGGLLFCVNLIMPGILILLKLPWLALAWLRGRNPIVFSATPWEELSKERRSLVFTNSIIWLVIVIAFFIWIIVSNLQS